MTVGRRARRRPPVFPEGEEVVGPRQHRQGLGRWVPSPFTSVH